MRWGDARRQVKTKLKFGQAARGGPHRAFVRLRTVGTAGRPDLKLLAEDFRLQKAQNSPAYKQALAMASAAKQARRFATSASQPFFGPNSKAIRRSRTQVAQLVLWRRTQGMREEERAIAIGEHIVRQGLGLRDTLAMARAAIRVDTAQERAMHDAQQAALDAYQAGIGAKSLAQLRELLPCLKDFDLRPAPCGVAECFEVLPTPWQSVVDATAFAHASGATNLGAALESDWKHRHQIVLEESCSSIASQGNDAPSQCYTAGVCLCSGPGKTLAQMGSALLAHMKKVFAPRSDARRLLLDGFIVLRLTGAPGTDDEEEQIPRPCLADRFFHIGLMYLSPFRPTLLPLSAADAGEEAPIADGRLYVQVRTLAPTQTH